MSSRELLRVPVNGDLVLDAGECEHAEGPDGPARVILPPRRTLVRQVLDYLEARPAPEERPPADDAGREGVAGVAVTLRWGSYFCVFADRTKPLWDGVSLPAVSRISDEEMARINIEASAALAEWIDLHRTDPAAMLCSPSERSPTCPCRRRARSRRRAPFGICLIEGTRRGW